MPQNVGVRTSPQPTALIAPLTKELTMILYAVVVEPGWTDSEFVSSVCTSENAAKNLLAELIKEYGKSCMSQPIIVEFNANEKDSLVDALEKITA